ncbi:hypothetical protein ACQPYK_37295 [Streptosporangium sp. CA-135522]|uniref:hypothetical protein n=1 Tax=Streptosporangium sp. CA-135522 TaxID=3240072 RepID=UPI003D94C6EA
MVITATAQEVIEGIVTNCYHIWFYTVNSDEIWQQFGVATWRAQHGRLQVVTSVLLSLAMISTFLWWLGAITPHIRWTADGFLLHAEVDDNGVLSTNMRIEIENEGSIPFTLTDISAEMPGLHLLSADEAKEERSVVTVESGGTEILNRRVLITDCAAVPHEPQPIHFTYRTLMGSGSAEVTWGSWRLTGPAGSLPVAWQRGLAGKICNDAVSPT